MIQITRDEADLLQQALTHYLHHETSDLQAVQQLRARLAGDDIPAGFIPWAAPETYAATAGPIELTESTEVEVYLRCGMTTRAMVSDFDWTIDDDPYEADVLAYRPLYPWYVVMDTETAWGAGLTELSALQNAAQFLSSTDEAPDPQGISIAEASAMLVTERQSRSGAPGIYLKTIYHTPYPGEALQRMGADELLAIVHAENDKEAADG